MERNPFPVIDLAPRLTAVADWIAQRLAIFPETDLKTSNHIHREYQPQLPFEE